jgi:hypothetical protein
MLSKITSIAAMMVVGLFMVGLLAVPLNVAAADPAQVPQWEKGDAWAMGKDTEYTPDEIDALKASLNENLSSGMFSALGIQITKLDPEARAQYYVLFEVVDKNATTYTVKAVTAVKVTTTMTVEVTGQFPKAGSYDSSESPLEEMFASDNLEAKTISADLTERFGMVLTTYLNVTIDDLAIESLYGEYKAAASLDFDGKNIPTPEDDGNYLNLTYKNYDVWVAAHLDVDLSVVFTPALDLFQFPLVDGEDWYTNESEATVSGHISGSIDARGLPAEITDQIFTDEFKAATGVTGFPIELDDLSTDDGPFTDGSFGPQTSTIPSMWMHCTAVDDDTYEVTSDDGMDLEFSSTTGFLTSSSVTVDSSTLSDDLPVDVPEQLSLVTSMMEPQTVDMETVSVETAQTNIDSISSYTSDVASSTPPSGGIDLVIVLVIVIVAAVILVGAVVMVRRKKT